MLHYIHYMFPGIYYMIHSVSITWSIPIQLHDPFLSHYMVITWQLDGSARNSRPAQAGTAIAPGCRPRPGNSSIAMLNHSSSSVSFQLETGAAAAGSVPGGGTGFPPLRYVFNTVLSTSRLPGTAWNFTRSANHASRSVLGITCGSTKGNF